jgi:tetratricopeptide (TPR) repeat protein
MGDTKTASESNIMDMIQEARNLYEDGKYKKSLNIYNDIIDIDENNVNALYSIGVIKAHQKENNVAIEFFERVNNIMPNHPPTVANLSYLLEKERPIEAAEYARIALITFPDMDDLNRIVKILENGKELEIIDDEESEEEVLLISEPVIESESIDDEESEEEVLLISEPVINDSEDDVLELLVSSELTSEDKARELNNTGDYIGAVKLWKEILETNPKSYEAWYGLSESLKMSGHSEKSIQCKNRGDMLKNEANIPKESIFDEDKNENLVDNDLINADLKENSTYKENVNISIEWYNKGINFLSEEKSSEALSCFEKAIGGCPKEEKELRVRSQNGRGDALYQMSKYSESILAYHAAISLEPSLLTGRTLYNMGQSYAFLELYEDALKCFEQSISRGLEKDGIEICKTQINRCKILLREQNKRSKD